MNWMTVVAIMIVGLVLVAGCSSTTIYPDGTWNSVSGEKNYHTDKYHHSPENDGGYWNTGRNSR